MVSCDHVGELGVDTEQRESWAHLSGRYWPSTCSPAVLGGENAFSQNLVDLKVALSLVLGENIQKFLDGSEICIMTLAQLALLNRGSRGPYLDLKGKEDGRTPTYL